MHDRPKGTWPASVITVARTNRAWTNVGRRNSFYVAISHVHGQYRCNYAGCVLSILLLGRRNRKPRPSYGHGMLTSRKSSVLWKLDLFNSGHLLYRVCLHRFLQTLPTYSTADIKKKIWQTYTNGFFSSSSFKVLNLNFELTLKD